MIIKTRYILILAILVILTALALSTCFTSYSDGTGTIVINIGGDNSRAAFEPAEIKAFTHTITLTGPGETQTETIIGEGSKEFELIPGTWNIEVRAVGKTPDEYTTEDNEGTDFPDSMLRALSRETVEIKTGPNKPADIKMEAATEVRNSKQLTAAIDIARDYSRKEVILISENIIFDSYDSPPNINSASNITILVDKPINISFPPSSTTFSIGVYDNSTLTLGRKGMTGHLTFDGNGSKDVIFDVSGAELIMEEGVTIQNGSFRAVNVSGYDDGSTVTPSYFTMNGGEIIRNKHPGSDGGAVYVSNFCSFTMNGGEISDNEASNGGGVLVDAGGKFTMEEGSIISGNKASYSGGGVYVDNMSVGSKGKFYMKGGTISNNEAETSGGGVYVEYGDGYGVFEKTGGTIYGNEKGINENLMNKATIGDDYVPGANGHAVYIFGSYDNSSNIFTANRKILDTTAGPDINLDSSNNIGWTSPD